MQFFEPTKPFLKWLAKYAGDRVVIDVGCGEGQLLRSLEEHGVKAMGIDPRYRYEQVPLDLCNRILPFDGEEADAVFQKTPKALVLFCRPCHNGFVGRTVRKLRNDAEVLYISKPENLKVDTQGMVTEEVVTPRCREEIVYRVLRTREGSKHV